MMADPGAPLAYTRSEWEQKAESLGLARFRGRQVFDAIHLRGAASYDEMTEMSRADRAAWNRAVAFSLPEIARRSESADGSVKYGLKLSDGALVEAVFMPHGQESASAGVELADARAAVERAPAAPPRQAESADERATVCLSSQTGCAVDCRFCVTGRLGAGRNLSAGEIVGQFLAVRREHPSSLYSLVFMGMGEPMLNFENVGASLDIFFESISPRRVTVSTAGFPDGIRRLGERKKIPNLAVSLNAADERTRSKIMPVSRVHSLAQVIAAMKEFPLAHRRRITAEYVLLAGVNDSPDDARKLARLLRGIPVKINVIPFNPDPRYTPEFRRPQESVIDTFVETLARARYTVTVRRSRGPDSLAACGQLKGRESDRRQLR